MKYFKCIFFVLVAVCLLASCFTLNPITGLPEKKSESESKRRKKITAAVDRASKELMKNLPKDSIIAVISGTSTNDEEIVVSFLKSQGYSDSMARAAVKEYDKTNLASTAAHIRSQGIVAVSDIDTYVTEDLEYNLVISGKFELVDRQRINEIFSEQEFQTSGIVDDNSVVSIGKLAGANIVITISVSTADTSGRITLKALDVTTARIITMARADF